MGRPNTGHLYRVMCWTRNKFHYAVRKLKKINANLKKEQLVEASEKGDIELMAAMKEIKGGKQKGQSIPECIEGETDPDNILDKFRSVYELLYNSAGTAEAMKEIKNKVKQNIVGNEATEEINKVTAKVVQDACSKMRFGKSDVSGSFTSEVLLYGPPLLFDHLASLFRAYLVHGDITDQLLSCAFIPLLKGGLKDATKTDSYRAIAGSSLLLKLLDNVILLLWGNLLSSDSLQFGFKCGTSTTQCTWLVREVTDYYQRRGTPIIGVTLDCSKAFDMCRFDKLFEKLISRGVPPVVIRILIHIYEEQTAFVKLCNYRSETFGITNGTRQGSVLSPTLFSVYLDDLLGQLRQLGVGCHVGGWWYGAVCYADDLMLLAPTRTAAAMMLECCEEYAAVHNLKFSTDPVPQKSKSKCVFFCGKLTRLAKPDPLILLGEKLPWVATADHLGHVLDQSGTMDQDAATKRARFIDRTVKLRDSFWFATPELVIRAVQVYACDAYGAMLYDFSSTSCQSFFKSWNTCLKLIWNVPRNTFTYVVENVLAENNMSLRNQVYGRYTTFFKNLFKSSSKEVRHLARIVTRDVRSVSNKNLQHLNALTGLSPWDFSSSKIEENLPKAVVPAEDWWRLSLLKKFLVLRNGDRKNERLNAMIDSLCNT